MKPGIYGNISIDDYRADKHTPAPSLNSSIAKLLVSESPAHARNAHPRLNGSDDKPETDEHDDERDDKKFDAGTAAHDALLEGGQRIEYLDPLKFVGPRGGIPKGFTNQAIRDARDAAKRAGRTAVLLKHKQRVEDMVAAALLAIERCPQLDGLTLKDGKAEQSIFWREQEDDYDPQIWCRARPDWISLDLRVQISYKSTASSVRPQSFARMIGSMGYDLQDAFYLRGARAIGAPDDARSIILAQENSPPYACAFLDLDPEWMAMADEKAAEAIDLWTRCMRSGRWPSYSPQIHTLECPAYLRHDWEGRDSVTSRAGEKKLEARPLSEADLADGVPL